MENKTKTAQMLKTRSALRPVNRAPNRFANLRQIIFDKIASKLQIQIVQTAHWASKMSQWNLPRMPVAAIPAAGFPGPGSTRSNYREPENGCAIVNHAQNC
jgi:hypothetical protein